MNPRLECLIVCVTLRSNKGVSGWDDLWRLMGSNWKLHEQRPFPPCSGSQICQIDRGFQLVAKEDSQAVLLGNFPP